MTNTMTKKTALSILSQCIKVCDLSAFTDEQQTKIGEAVNVVAGMIEQLSKPRTNSAATNEKRKAATANARAELVKTVAPILREGLSHTLLGVTAKELFDLTKANLPEDFTAPKVQNVLLREMREELNITEAKGKANTYTLKSVVA